MGRKRATIIIDRKQFDDYKLDKITSKVKTISVWQGVHKGTDEFAFVQKSGFSNREPREVELWEHLINGAKRADMPMRVFDAPVGTKFCGQCGDWVNKAGFSPKKDTYDGLRSICKTCHAENERKRYWQSKQAA